MTVTFRWFDAGRRSLPARAARAGPPFADFYASHAAAVLRYFTRQTGDVHRAFDLTAETFAKAFEKRADFRGASEQQAAAWLWSIARNELALFKRRRGIEFAALTRLGLERPRPSDEELRQVEELAALEQAQGTVWEAIGLRPASRDRDAVRGAPGLRRDRGATRRVDRCRACARIAWPASAPR